MNPDSALAALSAALNGEGPAVEILPGTTNNEYLVNLVDEAELEGLEEIAAVVRTSGSTGTPEAHRPVGRGPRLVLHGHRRVPRFRGPMAAGIAPALRGGAVGAEPEPVCGDAARGAWTWTGASTPPGSTRPRRTLTDPQAPRVPGAHPAAAPAHRPRRRNPVHAQALRCDPARRGARPAAVLEAAASHSLNIHLTYGSSETSGGCVYDAKALPGVEVKTVDGRIWLGGPTIASGYLGDPELTEGTSVSTTRAPAGTAPMTWAALRTGSFR